jgi:hypothetical protein
MKMTKHPEVVKYLAEIASKGGRKAAANMTPAQRIARARKAGLASAAAKRRATSGEEPK